MLFGMKKEKKRAGDMQGIVHALEDERGKPCSPAGTRNTQGIVHALQNERGNPW